MFSPESPDAVADKDRLPQAPRQFQLASSTRRILAADAVKGIAIILMVFGHTEQGGLHRQWWDGMPHFFPFINFADSFIYSFHMAAFFLLSGVFIPASIARRGPLDFTCERIQTLLYPYLLWGLIQGLTNPLSAPFRMNVEPLDARHFVAGLLTGSSSWFLLTLFLCQVIALLIRPMPFWLQIALTVTGSVLARPAWSEVVYETLLYLPFICIGMALGRQRFALVEVIPRGYAFAGFTVLLAIQILAVWTGGDPTRVTFVPLGLTGTAMLILLAAGLRNTPAFALFRWCGEASIGIFLLSPFFQGLGRELILRLLRTTHPVPQLVIPVLVATGVPALLWHHQRMLHLSWMFRWPRRSTSEKTESGAFTNTW